MSDLEEATINEGDAAAWSERVYGRAGGVDEAQHPPASPHLLIRASAGTGKTYRLTTRYLRLLRAGESAEHILATTFTRKAAGEVLGRVLGWLARSVVDARERGALDDALGGFGLSERDCLDMLRRLVDGLNRLAIGTIDSFFNRAARALRFELDIPAEPTIADDGGPLAQALRLDAIQQTLGEAAATDDGFQTLIELLRRVHHDTARRSVTEAIDGLVVGLYDIYRQHDAAALWSTLNPPPTLSAELLHLAVQDVVALGEQVPVTKKGTPRASWSKAYKQLSDAALLEQIAPLVQRPVFLAPDAATQDIAARLARLLSAAGASYYYRPALGAISGESFDLVRFPPEDGGILSMINAQDRPFAQMVKRGFDIIASACALAFLSPVLVFIMVAIRKDDGPVMFSQQRVGSDGRPFGCLKFRTMVVNAEARLAEILESDPEREAQWRAYQKLDDDPRITAVGKFLRMSSLDELPQLINVLKGDMSLVGPRPMTLDQQECYGQAMLDYQRVRPGLTGLWQVNGRNDTTFEERARLDSHYVQNWSLWRDVVILVRTVREVLFSSGR